MVKEKEWFMIEFTFSWSLIIYSIMVFALGAFSVVVAALLMEKL